MQSCIRLFMFLSVLSLASCCCNQSEKNNCLMYKGTLNDLNVFAQAFFPELAPRLNGSSKHIESFSMKDPAGVKDLWGNPFVIRDSGTAKLIYSIGMNGVDESGKGDDIALGNIQNKEIYCGSTE